MDGGVYRPADVTVPVDADPPVVPSTDQTTPLVPAPLTVNCCVIPGVSTTLVGEIAKPMPVPVKVTVCGDPGALSVIVIDAFRPPATLGENVTTMLQLPPAATVVPQLLLWVKSAGLAPVTVMLLTASGTLPVFDSVTVRAVLVVPTA